MQLCLHTPATFPVLTLPVEITVQIFTHCLPTIEQLHRPNLEDPPVVFLAVCRAWRDIALGTPALWSALRLRFYTIPRDVAFAPGQVEAFIHRWLGRAHHRPLSLIITTDTNEDEQDRDVLFPIARVRDIIHFYAPRIAHLELYSSQNDIDKLALDTVDFPVLHHALIDEGHWGAWMSSPVKIFGRAPQLAEIILDDLTLSSSYAFPASRLTKFGGHIDDLGLLTLAPNLIELNCSVGANFPTPRSAITHARLQILKFIHFGHYIMGYEDDMPDILPYLTLPKLRTLDIQEVPTTEGASLSEFLDRSGAKLRTLAIALQLCEEEDHSEWMECLTSLDDEMLEHFSVQGTSRTFLDMILGERPALPRLTSLTFTDAEMDRPSYDFLLQGLIVRAPHLESFQLSFLYGNNVSARKSVSGEVRNSLEQLGRAGMSIRIGLDIYGP